MVAGTDHLWVEPPFALIELDLVDVCPTWCRGAHPRRDRLAENTVRRHVSGAIMVRGSVGRTAAFITVARVLHRGREKGRQTWESESLQVNAPDGYVPLASAAEFAAAVQRLAALPS